jgi:conjugal transfer pilus assembly protein TraA
MNTQNPYRLYAGTAGVILAMAAGTAYAGAAGSEFDTVWTTLTGWIEGTLGQVIAVTFIIVGVVAGVAKGSIFGLVTGIAAGLGLITAPTVVDNMFTGTLPVAVVDLQQAAPTVPLDVIVINAPAINAT